MAPSHGSSLTGNWHADYFARVYTVTYSKTAEKSSAYLTFAAPSGGRDQSLVQPLTVMTGILLGSSLAISLGLAVVVFLAFLLGDESPQLASEFHPLLESAGLFVGQTALCAWGFIGLIKHRPWRWYAQAAMWLGLALLLARYWP